ncbi:MAG TPA: TRAP transporter small permease subunit [Trueperaceae bacterium]|nr:TRAP transporter small permease subunit [Trueperaceae bacterium]
MSVLLGVARVIDNVNGAVGRAMWWLSLFMVAVGVYNVVTRYFYGFFELVLGPRAAANMTGNLFLELQTYSFDLVFLLGAAYVLRVDGHVRVDIVYSNLSARRKAAIDICCYWLFLVPFSLLGIVYSIPYIRRSWATLEMSPNPGGLARYPIKTAIAVAFAMLILQAISETIHNAAFLSGRRGSGSVHESPPAPTAVDGTAGGVSGAAGASTVSGPATGQQTGGGKV